MKFALALGALAASAAAAPEIQKRQGGGVNTASALAVLETALPSSLLQLAITNSPAASSMIASEFAAGSTPSWFSGLPSDVQSYLVQASGSPSAAAGSISSALGSAMGTPAMTPGRMTPATPTGTPGGTPGTPKTPSTPTGGSSMGTSSGSGSMSTGGSGSGSGSGGSGSSGSGGRGSSASTGGVPAQTAAIGMGMAGFAAVAGILAL